MRNSRKLYLSLIAIFYLLFLSSCASYKTMNIAIAYHDFQQLSGMTEKQIITKFGEPDSKKIFYHEDNEIQHWIYSRSIKSRKKSAEESILYDKYFNMLVNFKNGIVNSMTYTEVVDQT